MLVTYVVEREVLPRRLAHGYFWWATNRTHISIATSEIEVFPVQFELCAGSCHEALWGFARGCQRTARQQGCDCDVQEHDAAAIAGMEE